MPNKNQRFLEDWARTKNGLIERYFPNYEDPTWGQYSEIAVAGAIGQFSTLITNTKLAEKAFTLSKQMAQASANQMVADWEDGDICPPPPPHWWHIYSPIDPEPQPWKEIGAAEQIEIAYLFTKFSALTSSKDFNVALKSLATEIVRGAAATIADEFERCGTLPHIGPRKGVAAGM